MASSHVEMASAPFGCVLRDHNRRDLSRDSKARATMGVFQKNLKSLVRDHLCIAVSSNDTDSENKDEIENSNRNGGRLDTPSTARHARVLDRWTFARQMVSKPIERQRSTDAELCSVPESENQNHNDADSCKEASCCPKKDDDKSNRNGQRAKVLDRWAFARQMVSKPIERQKSADAEVLSLPNSAPSSARTSTSAKEETIARTESLADLTKKGVGASSLVQIWEKRLHKSDSPQNNPIELVSDTSRSSSGFSSTDNENENAIVPNASPSRASEAEKAEAPVDKAGDSVEKTGDSVLEMEKARESIDESYDGGAVTEYSYEDSDVSAVDSRNLDAREKEKVRVVDIIRRLTAQGPSSNPSEDNSNDHDQLLSCAHTSPGRDSPREPAPHDRCSGIDQAEPRSLNYVISSPRIRGRQAFTDLLMQMERDRQRELDTLVDRKSVSRFSHRGKTRIQSLIRLRLMQRDVAFTGADLPPLPPKASRVSKPAQGSSIMHLREKFSPSAEPGLVAQTDVPAPNGPAKEIVKNISVDVEKLSASDKPSESTPNREVHVVEQKKASPVLCASKDVCKQAKPSLEKSSLSNKPSESTPSREVNVVEQKKTSPVLRASEDVCEEVKPGLEKSSTSNKPNESTPNREVDVVELKKTYAVLRASEDVREELKPSSEKSSTSNKPSERTPNQEVSVVELKKTSTVLCASEDVSERAAPSLEVTISVAQSTLPHVSEDLCEIDRPSPKVTGQETSSVATNLDSQETAAPSTPLNGSNENEICEGKDSVDRNPDSQETADTITSLNGCNGDETLKPTSSEATDLDSQQTRTALSDGDGNGNEISKGISSEARNLDTQETAVTTSWNENGIWHGTSLEARNYDSQENIDATSSLVDWDENDDYYQYYGETNYDWISEISRPRSYWEDIRKSWYQEMLNSNSEKGEIHQLLERRAVSTFLSSEFRDTIDRLMASRVGGQTFNNVSQEEEEEEDEGSYDRINQMMSFLQQRTSSSRTEEEAEEVQEHVQVQEQVEEKVLEHVQVQEQVREHEDQEDEEMIEEEEEEEEEEENDVNDDDVEESRSLLDAHQFQEAGDYFDHASLQPSPSQFTTWSYQDNEVGDDSDRATSPSPPGQESPFRSYYPISPQRSPSPSDNGNHPRRSPPINHSSMEMALIYDLKSHMLQLYQEMSELRKSIKSCVDMQMTMQQSMKQDVHSGQVGKKRNSNGLPKKGNCRICNDAKIDSLLYRCGHMCTCFKCAHDLQWNRGKCPICRAPIADVVRAYMCS